MKNYVLLIIALFFSFSTLDAQLLSTKRVKKSAETKSKQRVDKKVDQGIDKSLDSVEDFLFGSKKKKQKTNDSSTVEYETEMTAEEYNEAYSETNVGQEPDYSSMFGGTVEVADFFEFNSSIDMLMTTYDKKGKTNVINMTMLFPEDEEDYFGMEIKESENAKQEMPQMKMIYDFKNQQMITMLDNEGQKMGMVMSIDEDQLSKWAESEDYDIDEVPEWSKTGKKKDILGYNCEQYIFSSEDGDGDAWVTDDDDLKIGYAMNAMAQAQKKKNKSNNEYPDGAILEMNYNGKDGEKMNWITTNIETDTYIKLMTAGYQFMSMGGGK